VAGKISGTALGAIFAGAVFMYAGIKGKSIPAAVQAVVQGKSPATAASTAAITGTTAADLTAPTSTGSSSSSSGGGGPPSANKVLGQVMAAAYGWGSGQEWAYLESGWEEESGWSTTAANVPSDPYDHAYGIPQANPGSKMASAGASWKTSAATQIKWGLDYIKAEYGSPTQVPNWSASGPTAAYEGY
jgi:hypothetical protein